MPNQRTISLKKKQVDKRQLNRELKIKGSEYVTRSGKVIPEKKFRFKECKCFYKCQELFPAETRKGYFDYFYSLGSVRLQKQFILSCISLLKIQSRKKILDDKKKKTRKHSKVYAFNRQRVCANVFVSTLGISKKLVDFIVNEQALPSMKDVREDRRGQQKKRIFTPEMIESIHKFLDSIPKYSKGSKHYFAPHMNKRKLYDLYYEKFKPTGVVCMKRTRFNATLKNYNAEFFEPKSSGTICNECKHMMDQCKEKQVFEKGLSSSNISSSLPSIKIMYQFCDIMHQK